MSGISTALQKLSTHRDLVPAYYHRGSGNWIVTGLNATGGAVVVDDAGTVVGVHSCKREALRSISN